jgi:hypothetical protein
VEASAALSYKNTSLKTAIDASSCEAATLHP